MNRSIAALLIFVLMLLTRPLRAQEYQVGSRSAFISSGSSTTVTYAGIFCQNGGASPLTCLLSSTPAAGNAVSGGFMFFGSSITISSISDGGSTYSTEATYLNGTSFGSFMFYTCNYAGSSSTITITYTGPGSIYGGAVAASGNRTTGCVDGYNKAQGTSAGTTWTSGTVATTNAHDMLVGLGTNDCASSGLTAGTDGQGNAFGIRASNANAAGVETVNETATNTYSASMSGPSCIWNMEVMAIQ